MTGGGPRVTRFSIVPDRSTIVVEARSSLGPILFEATHPTGSVEAALADGRLSTDPPPSARLELELARLASGNSVYDAELVRRLDVRRHPVTVVELEYAAADDLGTGRFEARGTMSLHGARRPLAGSLEVEVADAGRTLRAEGHKVLDIRTFGITIPSILMMRIYPDVRVHLFVEARAE